MDIIVVGCGRVGAELAYRLFQKGHNVTVVDQDANAFDRLNPNFRGRAVEGEALNWDVLKRAGIETTNGLAMVTTSDPLNAVIAHVARTTFKIEHIVVRNYDPIWRPIFEAFGLQVVSSSSWGAQRIEEMLYHEEMRTVFSAGNGEIEIYELSVPASFEGSPLRDLVNCADCTPASITRAGTARLPDLNTPLQAGDIILISATNEGIETVRKNIQTKVEN